MKQGTSERVCKIRQETADAAKKLVNKIKNQTEKPEGSENQ